MKCSEMDDLIDNVVIDTTDSVSNNVDVRVRPRPLIDWELEENAENEILLEDMKAPEALSTSDLIDLCSHSSEEIFAAAKAEIGVGLELSTDCGLGAEDYYVSLFARCDPEFIGRVKVSTLLNTLRDLRALVIDSDDPNNSITSDGSSSEELLELKQEIDPTNQDPEISLNTFTAGMKSYLDKKKLCCL